MSVVPLRRPTGTLDAGTSDARASGGETPNVVGAELSGVESQAANPTRAHLAQAILSGDLTLLPARRDEAWRWSDLRGAVRVLPRSGVAREHPSSVGLFAGVEADAETVILDGRRLDGDDSTLVIEGPATHVLRVVNGPGSHAAAFAIRVEAGGSLTLLESYEGEAGGVAALDLVIAVARGGRCERIVLMADAADAVDVSTADVTLASGAAFAQTVVLTGARLQRHETRCPHPGEGASVRMDAILLLDGSRHADATTVVEHRGLNGSTSQVAKTVAAGRSRAVFQGRIVVARGADGTDARMRHDALILSEGAEVDAKPELEIYADDVQCAHGATIGALDEDLLFYVRSRGVPEADARLLLTQAFVGEVVDRIEHEGARDVAAAFVSRRLAELQP